MKLNHHSEDKLNTCHINIQDLVREVANRTNIIVCVGKRDKAAQDEAFKSGLSKLQYPDSKHNTEPLSEAVDLAPCDENYQIDWDDRQAFLDLVLIVKDVAKDLGINIVWGGDWKKFKDIDHYELA